MRLLTLALLGAWIAGCSGLSRDRESNRRSPASSAGAGSGGSAGSVDGAPVLRGGQSAPPPPAPPPPPPLDLEDAGMDEDAGMAAPCEVGKFCPGAEDGCGTLRLETKIDVSQSGNLLIVFDQSVSMRGAWDMTTKIEAARAALTAAITPLADQLTVGALFLPSVACLPRTPAGGAVAPLDASGQIAFVPGAQFLTAWDDHWATMGNAAPIGTPLNEAFDRADVAITAARANASLVGGLGVVVFTDGEPNCQPDPTVTGVPTMSEPERAAQWLTQAVHTYVVGLPGANGVTLLDDIAASGGTTNYLTPDDPAALEMTLRQVVEEQIMRSFPSCAIDLDPAADLPKKLKLSIDRNGMHEDVPHMIATDSGWVVSDDGARVELFGKLCEDAEAGRFDALTFEYGCEKPPPPPPPTPD
jgi:hypothetical protein